MKKVVFSATLFVILSVCACSRFDDMNKHPYALYDAPSESFVQNILYKTEVGLLYATHDISGQLMQYTLNTSTAITSNMVYNYSLNETYTTRVWQHLYPQAGNVEKMLVTARSEDNPAMTGVALCLKSLIYSNIADTYGNVPYKDAGRLALMKENLDYTTSYDDIKEIYRSLLLNLEEANACFIQADEKVREGSLKTADFTPSCDYMFHGSARQWRKFSNTLYLRLLMRCAMKVILDDGGVIHLNDDWGDVDVCSKLSEIYDGFISNTGNYPVMTSIEDCARVGFSKTDAALYSPFNYITDGDWNSHFICSTLIDALYDHNSNLFDPRTDWFSTRHKGTPTQLSKNTLDNYIASNTGLGRIPRGQSGAKNDLREMDFASLLNFSEMLFIFAEAGARNYIGISFPEIKQLYLDAIKSSILEWNTEIKADGADMQQWLNIMGQGIDADNTLKKVLNQKWVSLYWCGIESWCDYRRTGYPLLKTNGEAAENDNILPTRLRYPADEKYRNVDSYSQSINGWLGGSDNMQTEIWWADTPESINQRKRGRL